MTKRERAIKERMWLKIKKFAITKSLQEKLAHSDLTLEQQEWCCYIQSKVLRELRDKNQSSIHCKYFKNKIGQGYTQWVKLLKEWEQLDGDDFFKPPSAFSSGETKKYWIPQSALADGIVNRDFKVGRIKATKDKSRFPKHLPWIEFIHQNLKELSIRKELIGIPDDDPVCAANCHDYAKRIFHGEFNCRLGNNSNRLSHSVILMPKVARQNLIWKATGMPLEFEFDVKSCHPVLLLMLATDETERKQYCRVLDRDIYDVIRVQGDIKDSRQGCKNEWCG